MDYAKEEEIASLRENETWRLEKLPTGNKTVKNKWIFKVKINSSGNPICRKTRLVAKGFSQNEGDDYYEIFFPVICRELVRAVLSTAATHDLEILQLDVNISF